MSFPRLVLAPEFGGQAMGETRLLVEFVEGTSVGLVGEWVSSRSSWNFLWNLVQHLKTQ